MVIRFMKRKTRIFSLIMAFALMLTAIVPGFVQFNNTQAEALTITQQTVVVHASGVALRSGPSSSDTKLATLSYGANYVYGGATVNGFYRVKVSTSLNSSGYAYISTTYSTIINPATSAYVLITGSDVRIRTSASTTANIYTTISAGTIIPIVSSSEQFVYRGGLPITPDVTGGIWAKVYYSNKQVGYVRIGFYDSVNSDGTCDITDDIVFHSHVEVYTPPIGSYSETAAENYIANHIGTVGL